MNTFINNTILAVKKYATSNLGRPPTITDEHFLEMFNKMNRDLTKWDLLGQLKISQCTGDYYRKVFNKWTEMGVFSTAYKITTDIIEKQLIKNQQYLDEERGL